MTTFQEQLDRFVDRSHRFIPNTIDLSRTVVHAMDIQNLCLDPKGADYIKSVGGAPSGAESLVPAKAVLELARDKGIKVIWSLWGMDPDGADLGVWGLKYPSWREPDSPFNHGTWNGALCDGFVPQKGEHVFQKHRNSSFYNTAFNEYLAQDSAEYLVIIGSSTGNCVPTTARDGFDRGYKVIVVADAGTAIPVHTPGRDETPEGYGQYWESLRNIQAQYADVVSSNEFAALVERSAK
ncbi:cysteine hydrolase family protein [Nakamurella sp. PAMC28650]|uniref:cysteine hydrolase family protein n=1 Tax=Nakamurella sp. PAMC28650 TaxID=2762325 RepID=UPI00164D65FE|nr:cysteine hydrolase [Nakamurella sp. PAMC28650]QNK82939.1 cysteine hydrolase [Nakamurella sp. PAMC28650]